MWRRRHLISSVGIQGLGAAATFGAGLAIAAWQGPQAQGHYGIVRSAADLLLAFALFGLPQSMVHALNHRAASGAGLERMSWRYAAALLGGALVVCGAWAASPLGDRLLFLWASPLAFAAVLVGSIGWVAQGLLRALTLGRGSAVRFAWQSVLPSLTLLASVAATLAIGSQRFEFAVAASGIASAALAAWQMRTLRSHDGWRRGSHPRLASLLPDGVHAFAQSVTLALQPWVTLMFLRQSGASVSEVGHFVFAAYVSQAFALPTSFVAPLLFARISEAAGVGRPYAAGAIVRRVLGWSGAAALACAALLPWGVTRLFGSEFQPAIAACVILALAGPLLVANRLGVSVQLGLGRFRFASAHAGLRALAVPACLWVAWHVPGPSAVTKAGLAWLAVEALCAFALYGFWRSRPSSSLVIEATERSEEKA